MAASNDRAGTKSWRSRRAALVAALVAFALLLALFALAPIFYDVEEKGRDLLPFPTNRVYRVELLHAFSLYVDHESFPDTDLLNGLLLVSLSSVALVVGLLLRRIAPADPRVAWFYLILGLCTAWLAFDELFSVHETIGYNLRFLADVPGVEHPDDALFALYAIPALAFFGYFRDIVLSSRPATAAFGLTVGLFAAVALSDVVLHLSMRTEEAIEVASTVSAFAGVAILAAKHARERLPSPPQRAQRGQRQET